MTCTGYPRPPRSATTPMATRPRWRSAGVGGPARGEGHRDSPASGQAIPREPSCSRRALGRIAFEHSRRAGYLRLAAGFSSAEFEEGDGSVGAFFGTFVALSEPLGHRANEMGTRCRPTGGGSATSNRRASSHRVNRLLATGSWTPTEPARRVGLFRDRSPLLFKVSATGGSNLYQRPVPPSGKPFSDQNICRIGALPMDFSR